MNREPPTLMRSPGGEWWVILEPRKNPDLVRTRDPETIYWADSTQQTELVPEFQQWLARVDPGHEARPCYGMVVLSFTGEIEAMAFRLLTNASIKRQTI